MCVEDLLLQFVRAKANARTSKIGMGLGGIPDRQLNLIREERVLAFKISDSIQSPLLTHPDRWM